MAAVTHRFVDAPDPSEIQPLENRLGRVDALKQLLQAARFAHPGTKKRPRRQTATQFARCAFHLGAYRAWFGDPANPALQGNSRAATFPDHVRDSSLPERGLAVRAEAGKDKRALQ